MNVPVANGKLLSKVIMQGGVAGIAIIALVLVVWMKVDSQARPDAFTNGDAVLMESRLNAKIDKLVTGLETHATEPYHGEAGRLHAAVDATLKAMQVTLQRIERKLEGR